MKIVKTSPSASNKNRLSKAQSKLNQNLKIFQKQADIVWGKVDLDDLGSTPEVRKGKEVESLLIDEDLEDDEDDYDGESEDSEDDDLDQLSHPNPNQNESILYLPSFFGVELCEKLDRVQVMKVEVELREGQAYDALEELRVALAQKALLFRTKVRNSDNTKEIAKAWTLVNNKSASINKHVATYQSAYQALKKLNGLNDKLLPLSNEDLKLPSDITEENRIGQKSDSLAWFWKMGQKYENGMKDCKTILLCFESCFIFILINFIVYKVNWLRARARYLRWEEELIWVKQDMTLTLNSFEKRQEEWSRRAKTSREEGKIGHQSYALGQAKMWNGLISSAKEKFQKCNQ